MSHYINKIIYKRCEKISAKYTQRKNKNYVIMKQNKKEKNFILNSIIIYNNLIK